VALASLASYFTIRHQLLTQIDSALVGDVATAPQLSADGGFNAGAVSRFLQRSDNGFLQVITAQGTVLVPGFTNSPIQPTAAQSAVAAGGRGSNISTVTYSGRPYRVITVGGYNTAALPGVSLAIQIARPMTDITHTLTDLRFILWLVTLVGIAMAVGLGYVIGRTTLRPVARLTSAAEHVAATQDLDATIEEEGDDELARLARAFNSMLVALAASRHQQAQLISDAGHELRTPLTSLRTNIEVLMRVRDLPAADRDELVADVHAQLGELTTLIGDVVDLAREDEKQAADPIEVRLDVIVGRAVERARRRAPTLNIETYLTPGSVRAQPALLERAVLNLLDNAAKWSPPGGTVTVWLQRGEVWSLDVRDHGPGIAPEDISHIFDRFYRAPSARSMPGSGLGLAIVRQVVTNHGGTVAALSPPDGGTVIHIELPIVAESEPEPDPEPEPHPAGEPEPHSAGAEQQPPSLVHHEAEPSRWPTR
jgi:two-component system sensor histidine kinase MprB